jgi:hypothetical protein
MQRPTSATIFGILNIGFAICGAFGILATAAMMSIPLFANSPGIKMMRDNPDFMTWWKISIPFALAGMAALLISGIGLWCVRPWARRLAIGYAVYAVVFGLMSLVAHILFLVMPLLAQSSQRQGPEAAGVIGGAIGGCIGGIAGLIYPILLFFFMRKPSVVAAFEPPAPPPLPNNY